MMPVVEVFGIPLACVLIGFGMGREWQRVMGERCTSCGLKFTQGSVCYVCVENELHPPCPIGEDCIPCNPRTGNIGAASHFRMISSHGNIS